MDKKLKVGDLFSGIGGFSLGLERAGMETAFFCEIDPFCQKVLKKHWPDVPIFNDVRNFDYDGTIDVICGGFPCQPFSVAGKRKGKEDDRHLWGEMFNIIKRYKPRWVIGENVLGIVNMALDNLLFDLESQDYTVQAFIIPACAVNAPHRRDRVWIIAYNNSERGERFRKKSLEGFKETQGSKNVRGIENLRNRHDLYTPELCRGGNGISQRLDAIGNAVVPQIPEIIGRAILEVERVYGK